MERALLVFIKSTCYEYLLTCVDLTGREGVGVVKSHSHCN